LSSYLPAKSLPSFARLAVLSLKPDATLEILESLMKALFGWNYCDAVKMVIGLLQSPLNQINNKKVKELELSESFDEARFGFRLFDMILKKKQLCSKIIDNDESSTDLLNVLSVYKNYAEQRLESDERGKIPDQFLICAIELYYRFTLHHMFLKKEV
jgi:hypothetical protein